MKYLTHKEINLAEELSKFHNPSSGAIVLFSGEPRNSNKNREVSCLEYEAYEPMAEKLIHEILENARTKWNLIQCMAMHRLGIVKPMESAVIVITSSRHRKEAYNSNEWIIHEIKHKVPIWKKEVYADGLEEYPEGCSHD